MDADELDRRHGGHSTPGVVLVYARELPHLRRTAREAGYALEPPPTASASLNLSASDFLARVERALEEGDLLPQHLLLEPLVERWSASEVAAALSLLLREQMHAASRDPAKAARPEPERAEASVGPKPQAWVRLFLSVGTRDGIGAGDLLGAIIGESGVAGDQVGRIDLKDTFARVEVHEGAAEKVIRALNGTTIRGRSVRADFDRSDSRAKGGPGGGPPGRKKGGIPGRGGPPFRPRRDGPPR
jgi:ATP-dependent RNA helicase DeaD